MNLCLVIFLKKFPNKTIHIFEHGRHPAIISNKSSVVPMVINFLEDTKK